MRVGVLAVQGAFAEHTATLDRLEIEACPVRLPAELDRVDGLIIPGGESTTIDRLMQDYGLKPRIVARVAAGMPVMGTCAGMILMARKLVNHRLEPMGLIDITVTRNAFGRQKDSFEAEINIPALGAPAFPAVFIRAPLIDEVGDSVEVLARLGDSAIVAVRQGNLLSCAFHPELTEDLRFHEYFANIIDGAGSGEEDDRETVACPSRL